jgi:hypothetical protein
MMTMKTRMMKRMRMMWSNNFVFTGDNATLVSFDIPEGTTKLGEAAFQQCGVLVSVNFPYSVTTIGEDAFYNCESLNTINFPDSFTTIGRCAFLRCRSIASIVLPGSVSTIGQSAFWGCESLAYIAIPDSTTINPRTFYRCTELERIATEAGLSIEEWGRSNWRKAKALKIRLTMVSCIKRLSLLDDEELDNHLTTIQKPQIVRDCVRFLVEVGEPGLMREIVKYAA